MRQAAIQPAQDNTVDTSRPALAARKMLRLLSTESARQTLRPFYQRLFQELLARELEERRGKPAQFLPLARCVLGRRTLHSFIYRRYVCRIQQDGEQHLLYRYAARRQALPEGPLHLPAAGRAPSLSPEPPEGEPDHPIPKEWTQPRAAAAAGLRLSGADFRLLVRNVADALNRQSRLEALRRGGM